MRKTAFAAVVGAAALAVAVTAQEPKPVPKDSARVSIPGCTKGRVFTVGSSEGHERGTVTLREGTHIRMNGPKKLMEEIKGHEGSMIEVTGLMKKGQYAEGVPIGGGVRISPGAAGPGGGYGPSPGGNQPQIDVEGWRPIEGSCRT